MTEKCGVGHAPGGAQAATGLPAGGSGKLPRELIAALQQRLQSQVEERLEALQEKVEALASRLEAAGARAAPAGGGPGEAELRETLKKVVASVLLESGFLEKLIEKVVDSRLESLKLALGEGGGGSEALRQEAAALVKEFLSANLGKIFQSEIRGAIQKEMQAVMGSENMKLLVDDKFRAITLYLKTEVIPKAVRQLLKDGGREIA
jgi:hypothetical protein